MADDIDGAVTRERCFDGVLARLSLEEKVQLLTGRDFWTTWPLEKIGLRRMVLSDGPSGVRGEVWDERSPSLNLPSATALSSSWDPVIAWRYGAVAAAEARRKGVDIVLGPTINLHRSPLGGRHFEAFSEDPILTAGLAASYVRGVQDNGIAATPKHYVANDFETDRFTVDVRVDDRPLRELYLRAFEDAVVDARAWLVMSAYNSINGATATENELLETPLNSEWDFDGVVVSDWTAVRSIESAKHAQDLVMPGPSGPWGERLVEAVRRGDVAEAVIDRKVERILRLAARVGALEGFEPAVPEPVHHEAPVHHEDTVHHEDGAAFAREAAVEGTVLAENNGVLPLDSPRSVAVIGHNAENARTQGGGSATVLPEHVVSPLAGIRAAFPDAEVTYTLGAIVQEGLAELDREAMRNPVTGGPGVRVEMWGEKGDLLYSEDRFASGLVYFGGDAPIGDTACLVFETDYTPHESGSVRFGFASVGNGRIRVAGELRAEEVVRPVGEDLGAAFLTPPSTTVPMELQAGETVRLRIELEPVRAHEGLGNALSLTVGTEPAPADAEALLADAARAAASADVAVVVVGTNSRVESEGYDRSDLALPGRQDDLVRAVAAANPNTVVIVNSGSPVLLPWRRDVAALLLTHFGGQEYGAAIGDILTGKAEPGGRLPTTWPARTEDVPVLGVTPRDGVLSYDEGIHIGYRAWLRADAEPAYEFGYGLGYTTWTITDLSVSDVDADGTAIVECAVRNTGARPGKHVVQVYASRGESVVDRPVRWLVGHAVVRADAGATVTARVPIRRRDLGYWSDGWQTEAGEYDIHVGSSVLDIADTTTVHM